MSSFPWRQVILGTLAPVAAVLSYHLVLQAIGIGSLGWIDLAAYFAVLVLGFSSVRRAVRINPLFLGLLYFPLMLVVMLGAGFLLAAYTGGLEL